MARYDTRTTTFSQDGSYFFLKCANFFIGRLFQVEYAIRAVENAAACVGIHTKDAVIFATERRDRSKLLAQPLRSDKIYRVDDHVVAVVAGLTSDANVLVSYLRRTAMDYRSQFQESQPVDQLLRRVCDMKQGYTQFGGQRPFGVSLLYAGYDSINGVQLYHSDPTGNFSAWKARAIGRKDVDAHGLLKEKVTGVVSLDEAKLLAVRAFRKILDLNDDIENQMEINIVFKVEGKDEMGMERLSDAEVKALNVTVEAEGVEEN